MSAPPAGWYDDGSGSMRWWDGVRWTEDIAPRPRYARRVAPTVPAEQATTDPALATVPMTTQPSEAIVSTRPKGGTARAALVLGLVALLFSLIPFLIVLTWIPAILALMLGLVAMVKHNPRRGAAIVGLSAGAAALVVGIAITGAVAVSLPATPAHVVAATHTSKATAQPAIAAAPKSTAVAVAPAAATPTATAEPTHTAAPKPKPTQVSQPAVYYANCAAAWDAGAAPLHRGDPGYRAALDRDDDGTACEEKPTKTAPTVAAQPAAPAGATAKCNDGTYSYSKHHSGTCSYHGGVEDWL